MFSTAFNNAYNLSGSADPQTGLYSFMHTFGSVQANAGIGPQCELTMSFSSLATLSGNSTGLGSGWSFRLSRYNKAGKTLTLNSGDNYNVLFASHSTPWELSHKLKDILVEDDGDKICIYHKDGDTEILETVPPYDDAYLWKYVSASGRYLKFVYMQKSGYNRLTEIRDSKSVLVKVNYHDNDRNVEVTMYPESPEQALSTLYYDGKELIRKIEMEDGQHIKFDYITIHDVNLISKVTYSTGTSEEVEYNERLYLPYGAPIEYLPAVSKHTKIIGSTQPPIVTTFRFERQPDGNYGPNFWGYLAHIDWQDNADNLCDYSSEYTYSSVATCGKQIITHTYNKFHQNVKKVEENSVYPQDKKITTNEYYSIGGGILADQPETYELLKEEKISYEISPTTSSPSEVTSYMYDVWGNVVNKVDVTGITTTNEYYPTQGEEGGCPSHPRGMVYYLKRRTIEDDAQSTCKAFSFTYQGLNNIDGQKAVFPLSKTFSGSQRLYTYFDSSTPELQCLTKSEVLTMGGKSTSISYCHTVDGNVLRTTMTKTGHDGLVSTISTKKSSWTGQVVERTDEAGVVVKYSYDLSKRLASQTTAARSEYESKTTYTYTNNPQLPSGEIQIGTLVREESSLGISHTYYNGDQHETVTYDQDEFGILRKVNEKKYDEQGRLLSQFSFDYAISCDDHSNEKTYTNGETYVYGPQGERKETQYNTGIIELSNYDPVNNKMTRQLVRRDAQDDPSKVTSSLAKEITTYNKFHKKTKEEIIDSSNEIYSTVLFGYDGFGRKVSITKPLHATAKVTAYDCFNRQVEIEQFDGTPYSVSYIDFSAEKLVSSIKNASMDYTVGEQEYDGLLRVIGKTVNGVKTTFSYKNGLNKPSRQVNGRNQTSLFDQIPELGNDYSKIASFSRNVPIGDWDNPSKITEKKFTYAKSTDVSFPVGYIISASSEAASYDYEYTKTGLVKSAAQVFGNLSRNCTHSYTLSGKPLRATFDDRRMSFEYDEYGRLVNSVDGSIKVETAYDSFGSIAKISVLKFNSITAAYDLVQTTDISYDEHRREVSRNITLAKTGKSTSIDLFYDVENKIVKRVTTVNSDKSLTESLGYDKKGRLLSYDASNRTSDGLLPQNEYGKKFEFQTFAYSQLDNITSVVTTFPLNGGSDTATFLYDTVKKHQLKQVSHTLTAGENAYPAVISFTYDADGNVTSMNDTKMTYTVSGRLESRNDVAYSYDPFGRLVMSDKTIRCYMGVHAIQEVDGSDVTEFIRHSNIPIAEIRNRVCKIYGTDLKSSVVKVSDDSSTTNTTFSPFGTAGDNGARIGYNGELKDKNDLASYHLGNGTRCFYPPISGFFAPDSYSPFLGGDFNPYMYCNSDPFNAFDPSGHLSFGSIFGFIFGAVASLAAIVAAPFTGGSSLVVATGIIGGTMGLVSSGLQLGADIAAENGNTDLARDLGIASTVFGIVGAAVSLGGSVGGGIGSTLKSRSVLKASGAAADYVDDVSNVGFKMKFKVTTSRRVAPKSPADDFFVLKSSKGQLKTMRKIELTAKKGKFRLYKVKTPYDKKMFFRGNHLRSTRNTVFKNFQFSSTVSGLCNLGGLITRKVMGVVNVHEDDSTEGEPGSDSGANTAISSTYGLPVNASQYQEDDDDDDKNFL